MYGTQALYEYSNNDYRFENDVKMYGTQALVSSTPVSVLFENDVKMYGTQATDVANKRIYSLRMM